MYIEYLKEMGTEHLNREETSFCNFFYDHIQRKRFGVGSVWAVYGALNNYAKKNLDLNLNKFVMLRSMMRNITHKYLPKQSGVITAGQFATFIGVLREEFYDQENDRSLLILVISVLMWYGLLRGCEIFYINIGDVVLNPRDCSIRIEFNHATKTRVKPFKYSIPPDFYDEFVEYIQQLSPDSHSATPFLKYRTKKYGFRDRNVGKAIHKAILRKIESVLGLKPGSVTMHMFRRSGATQMADSGAGAFQLKVAGRWRSVGVAEVYVADSLARERVAMNLLSGHSAEDNDLKLVSTYHITFTISYHQTLTDIYTID